MALSDADVQRQIRHMMAFIEQEANEKAEEIDAKAEEEFNIEKGRLVQHHRLKIMEFYEKKEKQVDMKRKIDFSHMQNQARLKILKVREDLVKNVLEEARKVLAELPKDEGRYKNILQLLILQGVMQLLEPYVVIKTRAVDQKIAESVLPDVVKQYKEKTGKDVKLKVDPDSVLSPSVAGGVELNAQNGRIKISNTLEDRLQLIAYQLIPQIRMSLFGRSESRKFIN